MRLRVLDKRLFDNLTHGRTIRPSTIYMQSSLLAARRCHRDTRREYRTPLQEREVAAAGRRGRSVLSSLYSLTNHLLFCFVFSQGGSRGI